MAWAHLSETEKPRTDPNDPKKRFGWSLDLQITLTDFISLEPKNPTKPRTEWISKFL